MSEETSLGDARFRELRDVEFHRVDASGHTYLDYTGSALPPKSLIESHAVFLERELLGNPHADSTVSRRSTELMDQARARVLQFFSGDPEEYSVCFTENASAAIRVVAEAFPFASDSRLVLAADNHNSVNGIRRYAARAGTPVQYLPLDANLELNEEVTRRALREGPAGPSLFAYPAQSNFSGVQHPLRLIREARSRRFRTLLDAAAFVPSNRLRLSKVQPDYVCISFYKMFGYPTGVGALIARHDALAVLRRPWFSGGTVDFVSVQHVKEQPIDGPEHFEDGTPNFQAIAAVPAGLDFLDRVGLDAIHQHVSGLTNLLLAQLPTLRHANGAPMIQLYGPATMEARGGTVTVNLIDPDGYGIPYELVEREAAHAGISVRGGCFCNPGASERAFAIPADRAASCLESLKASRFTPQRFSECAGDIVVGAVRISLGLANHKKDLERLLQFFSSFRNRPSPRPLESLGGTRVSART